MLRTTNVSSLRADLSAFLRDLEEGPLLILSHSRPAAVMLDPDAFDTLVGKIELLEDLVEGRRAIAEYREHPDRVVDAEEVLKRLGH